jgi:hypothetical protein
VPSEFETAFVSAAAAIFATFGRLSTYQAPNGDAAVTGVLLRIQEDDTRPVTGKDGATTFSRRAQIRVQAAQVPVPVRGGKWSEGADNWVIDSKPILKNGIWSMECEAVRISSIAERRMDRG